MEVNSITDLLPSCYKKTKPTNGWVMNLWSSQNVNEFKLRLLIISLMVLDRLELYLLGFYWDLIISQTGLRKSHPTYYHHTAPFHQDLWFNVLVTWSLGESILLHQVFSWQETFQVSICLGKFTKDQHLAFSSVVLEDGVYQHITLGMNELNN